MNRPHSKRFLIALLCGCAFVALAGYLSTGTMATYPGIYYWCGLPYSYAIIVPATLMATICAREIDLSTTLPRACRFAILLGLLFTGYDLLAYFAPAVAVMLLVRRRFLWLLPVGA